MDTIESEGNKKDLNLNEKGLLLSKLKSDPMAIFKNYD